MMIVIATELQEMALLSPRDYTEKESVSLDLESSVAYSEANGSTIVACSCSSEASGLLRLNRLNTQMVSFSNFLKEDDLWHIP